VKEKIRNKLSGYLMHKEIKASLRNGHSVPISDAKTIGILYDATSDKDYEIIKNYVRQLMTQSKDVVALGYYDKKELPNTRFMKLGLDFFTQKSLNWKMKPYNAIVNSFIDRKVDILIYFNLNRSIPLAYVANQMNARFRIGKYDSKFAGLFDFMIKVDDNTGLKQMIDQVNHYLNLMNNEKFEKA
jgi:hypothetical protein